MGQRMVKLCLTDFGGSGAKPTLVLLHGLLGTARNMTMIARAFTETRRVIGLDMRNHGSSPWESTHQYRELACDVAETLMDEVGHFDLLGHSMGGKAAMIGVLEEILKPRKLIVGDIAPVSYDHSQLPAIDAMLSADLTQFDRRMPLAKSLGATLGDPAMGQFLAQAAEFTEAPRWVHNLALLREEMGAIVGFPETSAKSNIDCLFVGGRKSHYIEEAAVLHHFPNAQIEWIEGAGHWVHAEAPQEFNALVRTFLDP